ncbi:E3 ubiquitin-protein ligase RNF168-like [Hyaena hyaena]|uniref:E3 ubiquitin-protein ligase RNF168-like n=1 Tax=Hyaena hyaena TaxID=95912 RepID=UPI001924624C|nr:E3 ubiquitin-protein ligase RNF168-like [Hyaena hyaena]
MGEEQIQTLLAEEGEEERQKAEERPREMEEQLNGDEELARKLSSNTNDRDRNVLPPSSSGKLGTVTDKSQTKSEKKLSDAGDTPKYVSATFQFASTSQSEVVQESREISASEETDSIVLKSPMWQDIEIDEDVPTCFLQTGLDAEDQGAQSSAEPPVPQLDVTGRESCLKRNMKTTGGNRDEEVPALNHQGPEAGAPCFGETESACTPRGGTHLEIPKKVMSETENEDAWLLTSNVIAKGTTQEASFEAVPDPCISPKRRKVFPKASTVQDKSEINVTQNLIDTEHSLLDRNKQEELDWLFAVKLQKKFIKEQTTPDRQKGSPDAYQLRGTSSLYHCPLLSGLKKHSKDCSFKSQTDREQPKSPRGPENEK